MSDDDVDDLITQTQLALSRSSRLPADASEVALNLFLLSEVYHRSEDRRVAELRDRFHAEFSAVEPQLLTNQARYASRLASAPGELLFEEMSKLFSLLEEIYALRTMGYHADASLLQQMDDDVRARFAAQRKLAQVAAQSGVQEWSRSLWFYADNLR
jgi:hypothetical protein